MRIGQKTQRTRIWARKGTRPRQVTDLRTGCVYLFGAICPQRQTGAAVVMQRADTQGMQHHLNEISARDRKSTRLNSSHERLSRMPSSA